MKYCKLFLLMPVMFGLIACSNKEQEPKNAKLQESGPEEALSVFFRAESFKSGDIEDGTKTSVVPNNDYTSYGFLWSAKDTVGIFPDAGNQVYFTMADGSGIGTAEFDGGAWSCKKGHEFRSYYPFIGNMYLDATGIPVSFTGQKQVGNGNSDHFQKYDYMYTGAATKEDGSLCFTYNHLITVVLPWTELPAGHYTGLTLSLNEPLFVKDGKYDLTAASPAITGESFTNVMHVDLDVTFTTSDILRVYVPLAPLDISGKKLDIVITDEYGLEYRYSYNPTKAYLAGKIYTLRSDIPAISDAVDLGLSVKWAVSNLSTEGLCSNSWDYGDYYAWGEIVPKDYYDWRTYKWGIYEDPYYSYNTVRFFTKYIHEGASSYYGSAIDNKTVLEPLDDAAQATLGGRWRMPTGAEWEELRTNCSWQNVSDYNGSGVSGKLVTGSNGNSIFLPAAGWRDDTGHSGSGSGTRYWSSSLYAEDPGPDVARTGDGGPSERLCGLPVRPVFDFGYTESAVTGIQLNKSEMSLEVGDSKTLTATILPAKASKTNLIWTSSDNNVASVDGNGKVTAITRGTATIKVTLDDGSGKSAVCSVRIYKIDIPVAVDMGLSVKWASFNIGASAADEYGEYYGWGETEPKVEYSINTYKLTNGSEQGVVFTKDNIGDEDDVARVKLGNGWRIPTEAEWRELEMNCAWTWTKLKGVYGKVITASNGNSIFLPAAGLRNGTSREFDGQLGWYWSSSPDTAYPYSAWREIFDSGSGNVFSDFNFYTQRVYGCSIRPVKE